MPAKQLSSRRCTMWLTSVRLATRNSRWQSQYYFRVLRLVGLVAGMPSVSESMCGDGPAIQWNSQSRLCCSHVSQARLEQCLCLPDRAESPVNQTPDVGAATRHATEETGERGGACDGQESELAKQRIHGRCDRPASQV